MPDISFGPDGRAVFPTKYHGDFILSKKVWDEKCAYPERSYFRHNGEKVGTTLINPDYVHISSTRPNQLKYYKAFDKFMLSDKITLPTTKHNKMWAVIIDENTRFVCTIYPTEKPRSGKEYEAGKS